MYDSMYEFTKYMVFTTILGLSILLGGWFIGGTSNLEETKTHACNRWEEVGYYCSGYEGYQWGLGFGNYGGAKVWHTLKKKESPGIIYSGYIQRWGNEYHVYGPFAIDAVKGDYQPF